MFTMLLLIIFNEKCFICFMTLRLGYKHSLTQLTKEMYLCYTDIPFWLHLPVKLKVYIKYKEI